MKNHYRHAAKGFTLLELAVVSAILCILLAIIAPTVNIAQPNAIANQMWRFTEAGSENYLALAAAAQVDPVVPDRMLASGNTVMHVLVNGAPALAAAYQPIYNSLNIKPVGHLVNLNGAGNLWVLTSSPGISVSFSYTDRVVYMSYSRVPIEVTQALADRIQPGIVLQTGFSSYGIGNLMRYNCSNVNFCNVDLMHFMPW